MSGDTDSPRELAAAVRGSRPGNTTPPGGDSTGQQPADLTPREWSAIIGRSPSRRDERLAAQARLDALAGEPDPDPAG